MKVKCVPGGSIFDVNESYAMRLMEQGKAVAYKEAPAITDEPHESKPDMKQEAAVVKPPVKSKAKKAADAQCP